jgi:transcriptional regulator with XRE-family HTH domain
VPHTVRHVRDTDAYPNDWARLVDEIANRPGWSKSRLGREAGVDRRTVHRWISGESANVSAASIRLIAQAAGIDEATAARAATGAQEELKAEDDAAVRIILESDAPDHVKTELIAHVRSMRQDSEDSLMRYVEDRLRRPRPQPGT